jgi:hypothetical protein
VTAASAVVFTTNSAGASEPVGAPAPRHFGCVEPPTGHETDPVGGHPGAAGLVSARETVEGATGNAAGTAWNAVTRSEQINLGSC